jgi:hypothetical protein
VNFVYSSLFLLILFSSCGLGRPEKTKLAYGIMLETFIEVKEKYGLGLVGIGEEADRIDKTKYKILSLSFTSPHKITKEEGRKLIISISDMFLKKLNDNEKMQSYLSDIPYTEKNIEISIIVIPSNGIPLNEKDIFSINILNQGVRYNYPIANSEYGLRTENETIEEARSLADFNSPF